MAIHIIKKGKAPQYITTCPRCGTVFTFTDADLRTKLMSTIRENIFDMNHVPFIEKEEIVCPCCSKHIDTWENADETNDKIMKAYDDKK